MDRFEGAGLSGEDRGHLFPISAQSELEEEDAILLATLRRPIC